MKNYVLVLLSAALLQTTAVRSQSVEELLPKLLAEKNDSAHFYLAWSALTVPEKHKDKISEGLGLICLGYDYRAFGSTAKSLEYNLMAKAVVESTNDPRLTTAMNVGLAANYLDLKEYPKAIAYGKKAIEEGAKVEVFIPTILSSLILGEIYLADSKLDSALIYTQKAFELSTSSGIGAYLGGIYGQLGCIQAKLNNPTLAVSYFNMAIEEGKKIGSPKYINIPYMALAHFKADNGQPDSAIVYARKAIAAVQGTPFQTMVMQPAQLLTDLYRAGQVDSAFKYSEMYRVANDSLYNFKAIQQTQLMTFEEDAREQQLAVVHAEEEEFRANNIQLALIALGIVVFIIGFLVFSRSYIASAKAISFLSVVALLIVFDFLNLLLHPVIGSITHHSPVFMLLALVCIAALLIPLHHRLEKWAKKLLVEKNASIRLAKAKKTVEELETKIPVSQI